MPNLVELTVEKMFRCTKTDKMLQKDKYYFKAKTPLKETCYVETYYIRGNTIDNHRVKIHCWLNPTRSIYVHDVCELLETLYENNKTRTFRYLGEVETMGRPPRTYHKLLDVDCGYEYRHYSDLPIADWAVGDEKVLDIKLIDDSEELKLTLHQDLTDDAPRTTATTATEQDVEPDWFSPASLFEKIDEKDNYERLYENVYSHAQNRLLSIPREFLNAIEKKRPSWVFGYINYLLETYVSAIKKDSQLIRDFAKIIIKIELYICNTEGLMESLGITNKLMCAQKAKATIEKAKVLMIMADLVENPMLLTGLMEKMNKSLRTFGTLIEETDMQVAAVLNATLSNLHSLLQQNGEVVVEFLNVLSYRQIIKDTQKSKVRAALKIELLSVPDNISEKVIILACLMLLADSDANLDEDDRRTLECQLQLAIANVCDTEQRGSAFTVLVRSLSSQGVPDGLVSWESFGALMKGLKDDSFDQSLQQIMSDWPADTNACYILLNLVDPGFKSRTIGYQKLLMESLLYCWHQIDTPDDVKRGLLLRLVHISEIRKDADGVEKYNAMLQEFDNRVLEEKSKKLEQEIQQAIEAKRNELQSQWNELFDLAVSVGASDNTLSCIIDDRNEAIAKAEAQIRIDYITKVED